MKEVYILTQNWQIPERSSINDVCAVYASREDAVNRLRELYEEDVNWLLEAKKCNLEELDEHIYEEEYSYVSKEESFSENKIINMNVQ